MVDSAIASNRVVSVLWFALRYNPIYCHCNNQTNLDTIRGCFGFVEQQRFIKDIQGDFCHD